MIVCENSYNLVDSLRKFLILFVITGIPFENFRIVVVNFIEYYGESDELRVFYWGRFRATSWPMFLAPWNRNCWLDWSFPERFWEPGSEGNQRWKEVQGSTAHKEWSQGTKCQIWSHKACSLRSQERGSKASQPLFWPSRTYCWGLLQYRSLQAWWCCPWSEKYSGFSDPCARFSCHGHASRPDRFEWTSRESDSLRICFLWFLWFFCLNHRLFFIKLPQNHILYHQRNPLQCKVCPVSFDKPL